MARVFLALSILMFSALEAYASGSCVRYDVLGDTHCRKKEQAAPQAVPQKVVQVISKTETVIEGSKKKPSKEEVLEKRVDEFIENYGKPPREYVRFNLNPTLENALIWAQKFEEMNARTLQVSDAWGQAQDILKKRREQGLNLPEYNAEMPVPDFNKSQNEEDAFWMPAPQQDTPPVLGFAPKGKEAVNREGSAINRGSQKSMNGSITLNDSARSERTGPAKISYYFSAQCRFCAEFEPKFQKLIKELGKSVVDVTCVDVSPVERSEKNIFGKIDCRWRSVGSGEMKLFNIQSTPTLIIDKPGEGELKKIEGLTDMARLKAFLLSGGV